MVELAVDEVSEVLGAELFELSTIGDAAFDVVVDAKLEGGVEFGLADEDEVVVFWEVF